MTVALFFGAAVVPNYSLAQSDGDSIDQQVPPLPDLDAGQLQDRLKQLDLSDPDSVSHIRDAVSADTDRKQVGSPRGRLSGRESFEDRQRRNGQFDRFRRAQTKPSRYDNDIDPGLRRRNEPLRRFGDELFTGVPSTFAPSSSTPVPVSYTVQPGDTVELQLFGKKNRKYELVVQRDGSVQIPELGPIQVAGLSFDAMRQSLSKAVSNQLVGTDASVTMGPLRSIQVIVSGDAVSPGMYTVSSLSTMVNALFVSGGISPTGSFRRVELRRGGELVQTLDLYDLLIHGSTAGDRQLQNGDVIFIAPLGRTVSVDGGIQRPAIYELTQSSTRVSEVIKLAGGTTPRALAKLTTISRVHGDNQKVLDADFTDPAHNPTVSDGDKVFVPVSRSLDRESIRIAGHIEHERRVEWRPGMRVSALVRSPAELRSIPDLDYGLIVRRSDPGRRVSVISFRPQDIFQAPGSTGDLVLQQEDEVWFFGTGNDRQRELREIVNRLRLQVRSDGPALFVSAIGAVGAAGTFPLTSGMKLGDLIHAAVSLAPDARRSIALIVRRPEPAATQQILAVRLTADSGDLQNFALMPNDALIVFDEDGEHDFRNQVVRVLMSQRRPDVDPDSVLQERRPRRRESRDYLNAAPGMQPMREGPDGRGMPGLRYDLQLSPNSRLGRQSGASEQAADDGMDQPANLNSANGQEGDTAANADARQGVDDRARNGDGTDSRSNDGYRDDVYRDDAYRDDVYRDDASRSGGASDQTGSYRDRAQESSGPRDSEDPKTRNSDSDFGRRAQRDDEVAASDSAPADDQSGDRQQNPLLAGGAASKHDRGKSVLARRWSNHELSLKHRGRVADGLEPLIEEIIADAKPGSPANVFTISGEVRFPGTYPLPQNISLAQAVQLAGGYVEAVYGYSLEITHAGRGKDGSFTVASEELTSEAGQLARRTVVSRDNILIRRQPGFEESRVVVLAGEVRFPGSYRAYRGERLSKVLARAGGLSDLANAKGSVFTREAIQAAEAKHFADLRDSLRRDLARLTTTNLQRSAGGSGGGAVGAADIGMLEGLSAQLSSVKPIGRMVIDLPAILAGDPDADVVIQDGDRLFIPQRSEEVLVIGEVLYPTALHFARDATVSDYVKWAGGTTQASDVGRTYLIKANGQVLARANGWFGGDPVEAGDTVVVPTDLRPIDWLPLGTSIAQVMGSLALTLASLHSVGGI